MASRAGRVPSLLIGAAVLPLALLGPALQRPSQAQLVWTAVDPTAPQPSAWGGSVVPQAAVRPAAPLSPEPAPAAANVTAAVQPARTVRWAATPSPLTAAPPVAAAPIVTAVPAVTAQASPASSAAAPSPEAIRALREKLRIEPLVKRARPWPSPSLNPGVPSAFVAKWGDVFVGGSAATPGKQRDGVVDGSWSAGFGLGDPAKALALEVSGGCGSVKNFCANGSFTARLGRLLINDAESRLSLAAAWQNFAQWGNEGRQDNVYYGALSYAVPLQPGRPFAQTLQFNVGVGNSQYAPAVSTDSESQIGVFASLGMELTRFLGVSAGWSGRGANAQLSLTPFRDVPITINLLGADLFNQTPAGTVGVLSVSWGTNFLTPSF